ncbi:unnamed protein product [Microthlaspi erraticum]|uniref:Uncharacterized protein n=1 Tax=Microthlaspi erraticum TaxID=1685480 RepID=A0A6D2JJJ2_9BRAS|nr:unnamed protein product [Microthlaspi erraticum]
MSFIEKLGVGVGVAFTVLARKCTHKFYLMVGKVSITMEGWREVFVRMYASSGLIASAQSLFDKSFDLQSCNIMIKGYLRNGIWKELKLFSRKSSYGSHWIRESGTSYLPMERNLAGDSTPTLKWKKVAYGGMQIGYDNNHTNKSFLEQMVMERQRREARFAQGDETLCLDLSIPLHRCTRRLWFGSTLSNHHHHL